MPCLTSLPLSLSEILEARGGPLLELEIWALLCQCAEALQDFIIKGDVFEEEAFRHMVTPNCLLIRNNGTLMLSEVVQNLQGSLYMAPEFDPNAFQKLSDTAFEKMFVYSVGRTLQVASEFGLKENEVLSISYDLDSLLQAMSERNAAVRLSLMHILEACALQASQHPHKPPHSYTLSKLYRSVLGPDQRMSTHDTSFDSINSYEQNFGFRSSRTRRPRPHVRHRRDNNRSWSRSRSRSRSRSPSRGDKDSGILTASYQGSSTHQKPEAHNLPVNSQVLPASSLLNTSMASSASDHSEFAARHFQLPSYTAAQSVEGLLGLRQGNPAYQKYIQLKERQIRLRQARSGKSPSVLDDVRSRLMTPLMSYENMTETRSMASLMSYTLGSYKPGQLSQFGSHTAFNTSRDTETDNGSHLSLFNSAEFGDIMRAEESSVAALKPEPTWSSFEPMQQPAEGQQILEQPHSQPESQLRPQDNIHQADRGPQSKPKLKAIKEQTQPFLKPREYYGPEFFQNERKAAIKLTLPHQTEHNRHAAVTRRVVLVHLTGQKWEILLDPSTTGRQLFDAVIPHLDLDDFYFFGFTFISEGEHIFLDDETKLHKIAPDGWKDGPKNHALPLTFTLYVRVKFYPDSLTDFRHTSSYHLLYLQLRKDVVEERVTCDSDALVRLVGLALQVEFGGYVEADMGQGYFMLEHYFPYGAVKRLGETFLYSNAVSEHKKCSGIPESQAEIEFIKHVRHLSEYGVHFHRLFKSKSNTDSFVWVGLSQRSLVLAEPEVVGRSIVQEHPWGAILKISFNKRRFSIQPKMEVVKGKPLKINFYTNSYRKGRYLLQFSTDQHRFQLKMRTRPSNMETLAGDLSVELSGPHRVDAGVGDDVVQEETSLVSLPPSYVDPSLQPLPEDDWNDDWDTGVRTTTHPEHPLQYRSPPPYQPPRMALVLGGPFFSPDLQPYSLHGPVEEQGLFEEQQLQLLLDMTSKSPDLDFAPVTEKLPVKADPAPPYTAPAYILKRESQIGRHIFEVTLEKEEHHGIGLTIVGGETTNSLDLGIFVKSIVPGGPAARDGRIMAGDRLIAIGGTSLEGKQHHEAVELIRTGGHRITLLVSQIRPPGTIKKRNILEEHVDVEQNGKNSFDDKKLILGDVNDDVWKFDTFFHRQDSYVSDIVYNSDEEAEPFKSLYRTEHPNGLEDFMKFNFDDKNAIEDGQRSKSAERWLASLQAGGNSDNILGEEISPLHVKLRKDEELGYELKEDHVSSGLYYKQDQVDLQILKDIEALEANDSSSDSDFESAVKKTIDGPLKVAFVGKNSVNTSSPVGTKPRGVILRELQRTDVGIVYEVVLEKSDGILGIIVHAKPDSDNEQGGTFILKVLKGSCAERSGVLATGDKILEVAGTNVEGLEFNEVQSLLNNTSDRTVLKFLHPSDMGPLDGQTSSRLGNLNDLDEKFNYFSMQDSHKKHQPYLHQHQLFEPIDCAPATGRAHPKLLTAPRERLAPIAAAAPALFLGESESNTQSDVDSDVLDSSRSELESIYKSAELDDTRGQLLVPGDRAHLHRKTPENILDKDDGDSDYHNESEDFNAQLLALTDALDARLAAEVSSLSSVTRSCDSANSVLMSPKKVPGERRKSLLRQSKFDDATVFDSLGSPSSFSSIEENLEFPNINTLENFGPEIIEVTLKKRQGVGFGFTVAGGVNTGGCYVKQLVSDPAVSNGRIRPGDKILKVNGQDTKSMSHVEAVTLLRNVPLEAKLELLRFPSSLELLDRKNKKQPKDRANDPVAQVKSMPLPEVKKSVKELIKSMDTPKAIIRPYDYKRSKVQPDVHGSETEGVEDVEEAYSRNDELGKEELTVELIKPDDFTNSLGISVVKRTIGSEAGVFIKSVREGGAAARDGRLKTGDQIIKVNDISFHGVSQKKAVSVLREAKEKVVLTILRCDQYREALGQDKEEHNLNWEDTDDDISLLAEDALSLMERNKENALHHSNSSQSSIKTLQMQGSLSRERYISPRKLKDMYLPVLLSTEWLSDLPPLTAPDNYSKDILAGLFETLSEMVESGEPFEEFKSLHQMKESSPCDVGKLQVNKLKNRYRNVIPYDANRVKLSNRANDYINASHITVEVGDWTLRYIASQGPVLDSVSDFWRMLWQEKVNVVVMLTQVSESGKVKCHVYWPESKDDIVDVDDGALKVKQIRSYRLDGLVITQLTIEELESHYGREVTLLQYVDWPDNGVPDTALPLMKLLQLIHLLEQGSPPVIHCSAGIGRTGTLIAIDVALATIEQAQKLDMFDIVHQLRKQRHGMVQTTEQYLFYYTACMEALLSLEIDRNEDLQVKEM